MYIGPCLYCDQIYIATWTGKSSDLRGCYHQVLLTVDVIQWFLFSKIIVVSQANLGLKQLVLSVSSNVNFGRNWWKANPVLLLVFKCISVESMWTRHRVDRNWFVMFHTRGLCLPAWSPLAWHDISPNYTPVALATTIYSETSIPTNIVPVFLPLIFINQIGQNESAFIQVKVF